MRTAMVPLELLTLHKAAVNRYLEVTGIRAALCGDAQTATGARRWNDANVLALSLRGTSEAQAQEILDAWWAATASDEGDDERNIAHLTAIERNG